MSSSSQPTFVSSPSSILKALQLCQFNEQIPVALPASGVLASNAWTGAVKTKKIPLDPYGDEEQCGTVAGLLAVEWRDLGSNSY